MKYFSFTILIVFVLITLSISQELVAPESAAYDPVKNRYFISNFGDGNIIEIDSIGSKNYFKKGLSKSLGIILTDDILYVISNYKKITGFSISDTSKSFVININEAVFLNDITCDDQGNLYVTDSNAKRIYKIKNDLSSYFIFWDTNLNNPNGILFNKYKNSIIVCNFSEMALIQSINLKDSTISVLDSTDFNNLDGLTMDGNGNIYVSSWNTGSFKEGFSHNGAIYKYDNGFKNSPQLVISNLFSPADIFYNVYKSELVIPSLLGNDIKDISFKKN